MASKYLTGGAPTYTAATKTISGATMSPALDAADAGRTIIVRAGANIYWGSISAVVSATSCRLSGGTLPGGDVSLDVIFVLDQGELHTHAAYLARVAVLVQDSPGKLSSSDLAALLEAAVTDYGEDAPQYVWKEVAGTGAQTYLLSAILGSDFVAGYTSITDVEYPGGSTPPEIMRPDRWIVYDDGSAQDGSNLALRFMDSSPSSAETFLVHYRLRPSVPEAGAQNFPDTPSHFQNITLLAAAYACFSLAAVYAPSTDSTIMADAVNYHEKSQKYLTLARTYLRRYNQSVFGAEEPTAGVAAADVVRRIERRASDRGGFVFH